MTEKKETTVGGVRAVELFYRPIRDISSGNTAFYQTQTQLHTPGLGTLMPENFRVVSEVTRQCISLFELEYIQTLEAVMKFAEREINFGWAAVYMPAKLLRESCEKKLLDYCVKFSAPTTKICFSLSEKLLEETAPEVSDNIKRLRNRGFHFMLTDFGQESCPVMRLSQFEVDYVMLSPEVTQYIGPDERSNNAVKSIVDFVNDMGAEAIADGVADVKQAETLYGFDCRYCAGSLSGKYVAERYVRRRSDSNADK